MTDAYLPLHPCFFRVAGLPAPTVQKGKGSGCRPALAVLLVFAAVLGWCCAPQARAEGPVAAVEAVHPAPVPQPSPPPYIAMMSFSNLHTPAIGIKMPGVDAVLGVRPRSWYMVTFDFSHLAGDGHLLGSALVPAKRASLAADIAYEQALGLLPPGYQYRVAVHLRATTYALGPQWTSRPLRRLGGTQVTASPALGAAREAASLHGTDAFSSAVLAASLPSGRKLDWTPFYGGTSAIDLPLGHQTWLHNQLDVVSAHPFNDLLANGLWSYRYTSGLRFDFGGCPRAVGQPR